MFRKIVPLTHDQYLDEPGDSIEWAVRIDELVTRIKAEQEKEAQETA